MRIWPPFEDKIRHSIRDEIAEKPTTTMSALKEQLEKEYGRDFHFSYLRKLVGKVRNEISHEIDAAKIEPRLAELRENYRVMRETLLRIVYWTPDDHQDGMPKPLARDRVEAAKSVVMMDLALPTGRSRPLREANHRVGEGNPLRAVAHRYANRCECFLGSRRHIANDSGRKDRVSEN